MLLFPNSQDGGPQIRCAEAGARTAFSSDIPQAGLLVGLTSLEGIALCGPYFPLTPFGGYQTILRHMIFVVLCSLGWERRQPLGILKSLVLTKSFLLPMERSHLIVFELQFCNWGARPGAFCTRLVGENFQDFPGPWCERSCRVSR